MKAILLTVSLLFSQISFASAAETETVGVKGMVCAFCAQGITKKFQEQPEVDKVDVSLENKYVKLTYKEGKKLSHEKISELLTDAGYEVSFDKK